MNELEMKLQRSLQGRPLHGNTEANGSANTSDSANTNGSARSGALDGQQGGIGVLYKELSYSIVGAAIEVHRHIGPGQLESTYERALGNELGRRGIPYRRQVPLTAYFKGDAVGEFYADMIVDDEIILELKSVNAIHTVHRMQVLSYLRASGLRLGLLINFNTPVLARGISRIVR